MARHFSLRCRVFLRRTIPVFLFMLVWFAGGLALYRRLGGRGWIDAALSAAYLQVGPESFSQAYTFWGQAVLFGIVVGLVLREALENYKERCRLMAGQVKDHTIVIGYSHLGRRIVQHCIDRKLPYTLIERNSAAVDDLLRLGEPVIVDDARTEDALPAANIKEAKRVIIASDNLETSLIVTKNARELNPACKISARCGRDELVAVLQKIGADHVYSTSLAAFNELKQMLV